MLVAMLEGVEVEILKLLVVLGLNGGVVVVVTAPVVCPYDLELPADIVVDELRILNGSGHRPQVNGQFFQTYSSV